MRGRTPNSLATINRILCSAELEGVVAGWRAMNPRGTKGIRLYVPGDAAGVGARTFEISGPEVAVEDLKLADLDGDGRLDIIAAGRQTKNVRIFFNLGAK